MVTRTPGKRVVNFLDNELPKLIEDARGTLNKTDAKWKIIQLLNRWMKPTIHIQIKKFSLNNIYTGY